MDVESDEKDSDYEISSDNECHSSSESSDSVMIIPPTPVKRESLMLKASLVKKKITKEENFSEEKDVVEENDNIEDNQDEDKGSDDEKEDEYESLQDDEDEVPEDDIGDEEWQQWAVKEFYKGRPRGFRHQILKYFTNMCKISVVEQTKNGRPASTQKMFKSFWITLIQRMTPLAASLRMEACRCGGIGENQF